VVKIMSEDATYRMLKRIPIEEMMDKVVLHNQLHCNYFLPDSVFEENGWSRNEYSIKFKEYLNKMYNH
jgi:hypothetical protein